MCGQKPRQCPSSTEPAETLLERRLDAYPCLPVRIRQGAGMVPRPATCAPMMFIGPPQDQPLGQARHVKIADVPRPLAKQLGQARSSGQAVKAPAKGGIDGHPGPSLSADHAALANRRQTSGLAKVLPRPSQYLRLCDFLFFEQAEMRFDSPIGREQLVEGRFARSPETAGAKRIACDLPVDLRAFRDAATLMARPTTGPKAMRARPGDNLCSR